MYMINNYAERLGELSDTFAYREYVRLVGEVFGK